MTRGLRQDGMTLLMVVLVVALLSGCGSSPVSPELPRSPLVPGKYLLHVFASDAAQTCAGPLDAWRVSPLPDPLPSVGGVVTILSNGLGRSPTPADGTLEMQLDTAPVGAAAVTGTIKGRLAHFLSFVGPRSAEFAATTGGDPARFNLDRVGTESPAIYLGTITGTVSFTAVDNSVVTCPQAQILLGPDR